MTYYKATRTDGSAFHDLKVLYTVGEVTKHPRPGRCLRDGDAAGYLSISTSPTDCTGFSWPARLFEVEPVGKAWSPHASDLPNKRAARAVRVIRELPAHMLFGPQGEHVVALLERVRRIGWTPLTDLDVAWEAANRGSYRVARQTNREAAWDAAGDMVWGAVWGEYVAARAVRALVVRDLIGDTFTQEHYDLLTGPWRKTVGKIHPDDAELSA